MITAIGIVTFFAAVYCFLRSADSLFALLIFSSLFPATAAITGDLRWVPPYYIIICFFILRPFLIHPSTNKLSMGYKGKVALFSFGLIAVLSVFLLPIIFAGTPVYSPQIGIDDGMLYRPPLQLGWGQVGQAGYLLLQIMAIISASRSRAVSNRSAKAYWFAGYFLVAIVFIQFACKEAGVIFPNSIIQNNPYHALQFASDADLGWEGRSQGTFSEPSGAGAMLAAFALALMSQSYAGKHRRAGILVTWLAIGMVGSSSSLVAVAVATLFLIFSNPIFRFPWYIRRARAKTFTVLVIGAIVVVVVLVASPLGPLLYSQTFSKQESLSYIHRLAADEYSLELLRRTYGFGVGLGSNRPSSLLSSLLSNVGILGSLVFFVMCVQLLSNAKGQYTWIRWAAVALLIDLVLGGPDITSPLIWTLLTMSVWFGSGNTTDLSASIDRVLASKLKSDDPPS